MIHFHFCSFYKFTIKPPEITLAGGYAFDVTPEKACWLFIPFLFEKNATFSAEMKNWVLDKLRRDTNDLGKLYARFKLRIFKYEASTNHLDDVALKSVALPASMRGTSVMSPGFCQRFRISVLNAPP